MSKEKGDVDGKAVQIVKYDQTKSGNAKFHYMVEEIKKIFLADDVKDKKAVIISIAGPARKGKSFMLGFFMKYLQDPDGAASWDENEPLKTFQWGGGCKSITSGLWIWNKPFISKTASGEEVAVFLMDSQGLYDRNSSMNDSTLIFAFSVLFSSIQVYNLMQDIQCNDLEHLEPTVPKFLY
ncbi:atlastin-2-like [Saccostrea cucullata]|uniref:atlastin-2-like n=1 Tax=Saccostrea cuccullata TaxID=36930 RepID=UPI002ED68EBE